MDVHRRHESPRRNGVFDEREPAPGVLAAENIAVAKPREVCACQHHFRTRNPPPDLSFAFASEEPTERLESVLRGLYGWYRRTERMSKNVRRDRELVPALDALMRETADAELDRLTDALASAFAGGRRPNPVVRAAVALALDFWTWRRLATEGLADRTAARLMAGLVQSAPGSRPGARS